ncbi:MAG: ABC transporter ATP-binding protein [Planctomycetota bacterium]
MSARVVCRGLTRRFQVRERTITVLDGIDLEVEPGEFVALVGPSGSGKSTLLGLLAGLDRADAGTVSIDGQELGALDEDELALLRRRRLGFVFQDFQLLEHLTARENVALPLELIGARDSFERADALLARVGLADRITHLPSRLSGGENQRVALARAFAHRPELLLADEPTGSLDRVTGLEALALLEELRREQGTTLIMVTHDPDVAARADRTIELAAGRLVTA